MNVNCRDGASHTALGLGTYRARGSRALPVQSSTLSTRAKIPIVKTGSQPGCDWETHGDAPALASKASY